MKQQVNIAKQFTDCPGGRYESEGPYSGEEFRRTYLAPLFGASDGDGQIEVVLDGVLGYATSFLEEAFGGLVREFGLVRVQSRLRFVSIENPLLVDEILSYMKDASS